MDSCITGYQCLLCGDIIYQRNYSDTYPCCRCSNIYFDFNGDIKNIKENTVKKISVELGDGIDKNVLHIDYKNNNNLYGVIESEIDEYKLNALKAEILLLKA